jgi:ParB family transcriptional regulator, chromosome partitioning protein
MDLVLIHYHGEKFMSNVLKKIKLADIYGNPNQPRRRFDAEGLAELAGSIEMNGLVQPITVRKDDDGRYMIVAGERRYRAHRLLQDAGKLDAIMCRVVNVDDAQLAVDAIIENDQRVDVTLMEQARSYSRMIEVFGYTPEALATKLGKTLSRVQHRLRLLNLTEECQHLLERGQLMECHAFYLAGLSHNGQGLLLRQINKGMCRTVGAIKEIAAAIEAAEAQTSMFGDAETEVSAPVSATVSEISAARGFEAKLDGIAAMLRAGIEDTVVTAVRKVNPGRAATIAALLAEMQKDMHRLEKAFRVAAFQDDIAA